MSGMLIFLHVTCKALMVYGIPKIYWQCSGQRLLVMEYVKGVRIDKIEQIKEMGVDPKQIARLGFQAYWKQVFDDSFFLVTRIRET